MRKENVLRKKTRKRLSALSWLKEEIRTSEEILRKVIKNVALCLGRLAEIYGNPFEHLTGIKTSP